MSRITQFLSPFDESKFPYEGVNFRENAAYAWTWQVNASKEQNIMFNQANALANVVNTKNTNVNNKHTDVTSKHSEVISARDTVVAKANEVKNLQLPTQATYTYEEFNKMLAATFEKAGFIYHHKPLIHPEDVFEETNIPNTLRLKAHMFNGFFDGDKIIDFGVDYIDILFPEKPFAPTSTDELLDDKVHGLICQQAHNKGDFIVSGNELISNGDFKSGTLNWQDNTNGGTFEIIDSILHITTTSTSNEAFQSTENISLKGGIKYVFTYRITDTSNGGAIFNSLTGGKLFDLDTTIGVHTHIYTVSSDTNFVFKIRMDGANNNLWICDISIRQKDAIYQAVKNISEMYDYEIPSSYLAMNLSIDDVVYNYNGNNANGIENHYYKCVKSINGNLKTLNLASNEFWLDLGTAENMSLKNPYFEKRTKVTRRDFILFNKTTKTFQTFKGYKEFNVAAPDVNDFIEVYDEYSLVKSNVITDGINEFVFIGVMGNCLNAGAYHFVFNSLGTAGFTYYKDDFSSTARWHNVLEGSTGDYIDCTFNMFVNGIKSIINAFDGSIVGGMFVNARDDKKFFDKQYIYGLNAVGFNFLPIANSFDKVTVKKYLEKYYIENGNVCNFENEIVYSGLSYVNNTKVRWGIGDKLLQELFLDIPDGAYINDYGYKIHTENGISINPYKYMSVLEIPGHTYLNQRLIFTKKSNIVSYGSFLNNAIIGSANNYLDEWKSWLSSEKSILGTALFVGQDGSNYSYNEGDGELIAILDKKVIDGTFTSLSFNDNNLNDWNSYSNSIDIQSNSKLYNFTGTRKLFLQPYIAKHTLEKIDFQSLDYISDNAVFSNALELNKGSNIANSLNFVCTGDSSSNVFLKDNMTRGFSKIIDSSSNIFSVKVGEEITFIGFNQTLNGVNYKNKILTLKRISDNLSNAVMPVTSVTLNPNDWDLVYSVDTNLLTIPNHEPITANTTNSPAAKWFSAISKDYYQIFIKELVYNTTTSSYDGDNNKFDQLTNGIQTDLNGKKIKTKVVGVKLC